MALLARHVGSLAYLFGYLTLAGLFATGLLVVKLTGFVMYGYDPNDMWQRVGAVVFLYSPLGLPLLIGFPPVVILDVAVGLWRTRNKLSREQAR